MMVQGENNMNLEQIRTFVEECGYPITEGDTRSCCVDGRVTESDAKTPAARPGGNAGDSMTAIGALRRLEVADIHSLYRKVFDTSVRVGGGPKQVWFHTDTHAPNAGEPEEIIARGCGHLRHAGNDPEAYGLVHEDMTAIFAYLVSLREQGATEVVLQGDHAESAVLVVDSDTIGVRHGDDTGQQAFVYHARLDEIFLTSLAVALAEIPEIQYLGVETVLHALIQVSKQQRDETLSRLAKGSPIYSVANDGVVTHIGDVP